MLLIMVVMIGTSGLQVQITKVGAKKIASKAKDENLQREKNPVTNLEL